jgi:hypothetical protein
MRRQVVLVLAAVFTLTALFLGSCSKDDKGNNGNNVDVGDPNDAKFLKIKSVFGDQAATMAVSAASSGMTRLVEFDSAEIAGGGALGKNVSYETDSSYSEYGYHPTQGWWVGYVYMTSDSLFGGPIFLEMYDSLRFLNASSHPQVEPDETTDEFRDIFTVNHLTADVDSLGNVSITARTDMTYSDLQTSIATVNGSYHFSFSGVVRDSATGEDVTGQTTATFDITNLRMPRLNQADVDADEVACPVSGVMSYQITESYISQMAGQQTQNYTWSVVVTIVNQTTYTVKIKLGNVEWEEYTITNVCSSATTSRSLVESLLGLIKGF